MTKKLIIAKPGYIDTAIAATSSILNWGFRKVIPYFSHDEWRTIERLDQMMEDFAKAQYKKKKVQIQKDVDIKKVYILRERISLKLFLSPTEVSLIIDALRIIEIEFRNDLYNMKNSLLSSVMNYPNYTFQDIIDSQTYFMTILDGLNTFVDIEKSSSENRGAGKIHKDGTEACRSDVESKPFHIKVYFEKDCTVCTYLIKKLKHFSEQTSDIRLTLIDFETSYERLIKDRVRSTPTTILENTYRWLGTFEISELVSIIREPRKNILNKDLLIKMIVAGDIKEIGDLICDRNEVFEGLVELATHQIPSARSVFLAVAEYIFKHRKDLGAQIAETVYSKFWKQPDKIQADLIYYFGSLEDNHSIGYIKEIFEHIEEGGEAKEMAKEILEEYKESDLAIRYRKTALIEWQNWQDGFSRLMD